MDTSVIHEFKVYGLDVPFDSGTKTVSIPHGIRIKYYSKCAQESPHLFRTFVYFTDHCGMFYPEIGPVSEKDIMAWVREKLVHAIMTKPAPTDWFNVLLWKEYRGIKNYFDEERDR